MKAGATGSDEAENDPQVLAATTMLNPVKAAFLSDAWWRRGGGATLQLAKDHGWRADADANEEDGFWIGRDWDGRSDIDLGGETLAATTVWAIIEELRRGIASRSVAVARPPDHTSIRVCSATPYNLSTLVLDVDLGDFILPVSVDGDLLVRHPGITTAEIISGMVEAVLRTHAMRSQIAGMEMQLRSAFEELSVASEILPLWLRMYPWRFNATHVAPLSEVRDMTVLMLDENLRPEMRSYAVGRVEHIVRYLTFYGEGQRRRAAMRSKLDAAGSAGFATDVALGLMRARGMDPVEVLTRLQRSGPAQRLEGIVNLAGATRERLSLFEGVVDADLAFPGGDYESGRLTLDGDYPRTLAASAKGRQLSDFVDHPAFRAAGIPISQARALRGRLRLYHKVRTSPIEDLGWDRSHISDA